jgi:large subunit ribosomal protein LP1
LQPEKILTLTDAAAIDLEPIWATLLVNALKGRDIHDMLSNVHAIGNAAQTPNTTSILAPAVRAADTAEPDEDPPQDDDEDSDGDLVRGSSLPCTRLLPRIGSPSDGDGC